MNYLSASPCRSKPWHALQIRPSTSCFEMLEAPLCCIAKTYFIRLHVMLATRRVEISVSEWKFVIFMRWSCQWKWTLQHSNCSNLTRSITTQMHCNTKVFPTNYSMSNYHDAITSLVKIQTHIVRACVRSTIRKTKSILMRNQYCKIDLMSDSWGSSARWIALFSNEIFVWVVSQTVLWPSLISGIKTSWW